MARTTQDKQVKHLARLLMESTVAAYVAINGDGNHDHPDLRAIRLGQIGYERIARELFNRNVRPPLEEKQ